MILNKEMLEGKANAVYMEHLLNKFNGEVRLTKLFEKGFDTEYELKKGRMNIVTTHCSGNSDILAHEIAHIVESPMSRVIKDNFGFKFFGLPKKAKTLFATISTEIRVYAIESLISGEDIVVSEYVPIGNGRGKTIDFKRYAKRAFYERSFDLARLMPNKFKDKEAVINWGTELFERTRAKYSSLDVIEIEFNRKIAHVNEHYCLIFWI